MNHAIKHSLLLILAPIIFGCSTSVRDAAAPGGAAKPHRVVCENARMQHFASSPRDCIERGGKLL